MWINMGPPLGKSTSQTKNLFFLQNWLHIHSPTKSLRTLADHQNN